MKSLFIEGLFWIMHGIFMFVHWLLPNVPLRTNILIKIMKIQKTIMPELPDFE